MNFIIESTKDTTLNKISPFFPFMNNKFIVILQCDLHPTYKGIKIPTSKECECLCETIYLYNKHIPNVNYRQIKRSKGRIFHRYII